MPENSVDLNIIMKLIDEATAKLKEAVGEINDSQDDTKKKAKETSETTEKGFDKAAKSVRAFKRDLLLVAGAVAAVYTSVKTYARYNAEAQASVDELEKSLERFKVTAGAVLLPVLREVNRELGIINWAAQKIGVAFNFYTSGGKFEPVSEDTVGKIMDANAALDAYNQKMKDADLLYRSGQMSAGDYFSLIMDGENQVMSIREQGMAQMQELANLQTTLGNQQLMEAQRITSEQVALLQFYKQEYEIAHQGMAAFTVMLGQAIQTNLSGAFTDMILGTKDAKQAFAELGKAMLRAIVDFMVQKVVASVLEKALLASTVASSTAAGAAVAAAWADAAALVSLATFGANAIPAAAGIASVSALTKSIALSSKTSAVSSGLDNSGISGGGSNGVSYGGGWAEGGEGIVTRPTLFLAGEAGPERFQFTPVGKESGESKTVNFHVEINIDSPVVSKEADLDYLTEAISRRVFQEVERIR